MFIIFQGVPSVPGTKKWRPTQVPDLPIRHGGVLPEPVASFVDYTLSTVGDMARRADFPRDVPPMRHPLFSRCLKIIMERNLYFIDWLGPVMRAAALLTLETIGGVEAWKKRDVAVDQTAFRRLLALQARELGLSFAPLSEMSSHANSLSEETAFAAMKRGALFEDDLIIRTGYAQHGRFPHAAQFLADAVILDTNLGPGSATEYWSWLGTAGEGRALWAGLYEQREGPSLANPAFVTELLNYFVEPARFII